VGGPGSRVPALGGGDKCILCHLDLEAHCQLFLCAFEVFTFEPKGLPISSVCGKEP